MSYVTLLPEQPVLDDRDDDADEDDDDVDADDDDDDDDDDDIIVQSSSPLRAKLEISHLWVDVAPRCNKWTADGMDG